MGDTKCHRKAVDTKRLLKSEPHGVSFLKSGTFRVVSELHPDGDVTITLRVKAAELQEATGDGPAAQSQELADAVFLQAMARGQLARA